VGVVSLSFYRFRGAWPKFWAFTQMQLARGPMARTPGVRFSRTLGTGSGDGFDPWPNFSVYAHLAAWNEEDQAREALENAPVFARHRRRAEECWTLFLAPSRAKGRWGGAQPFALSAENRTESTPSSGASKGPIAVLTRATIHPRCMLAFWRSVPAVSRATRAHEGLRFKIGLGELPFAQLMTFSLWDDEASIRRFAYARGAHHQTLQRAHAAGWFREDLFARFRVVGTVGTWQGVRPLEAAAPELAPALRMIP